MTTPLPEIETPDAVAEPAPRQGLADRMATAPINPGFVGAMGLLHLFALAAVTQPFELRFVPLMAGMYAWMCLATTLYMHRSLTHKGLVLAAPLRLFFALGTAANLGGDPVVWVGVHRRHHASVEGPDDPHSPRRGFFHSHVAWAFRLNPELDREFRTLAPDVRADVWCRWLEKPPVYGLTHLAIAGSIYAAFGLPGLLWGLYVPVVVLAHATFAVNSICHMPRFGARPNETRDDSRNVGWLALATFGECFHNNHHADPRRARHGLSWREPDVTAAVAWVLSKVGLARDVAW